MRRFLILCALCIVCAASAWAQQAKYVFYFIGDGMGLNQINTTEYYMASAEGKWGYGHLSFADFPYTTYAANYSANRRVTDSAAAGTALATGHKTNNGMLGMTPDSMNVSSIATWAKQSGKKVGVCTTVSIDDATPAAFYSHQASRKSRNAIGRQLATSGFDYFAGSDFRNPKGDDGTDLHQICEANGYTWARKAKPSGKMPKNCLWCSLKMPKEKFHTLSTVAKSTSHCLKSWKWASTR